MSGERDMSMAVRSGIAALMDGRTAQEVLERVWQAAYACGVRDGREQPPGIAPGVRQALGPHLAAVASGWKWGTVALLGLQPGDIFRYGGTAPGEPVADRAVMLGSDGRLEFADTGERVRPPVMFWALRGAPGSEPPEGEQADGDPAGG